MQVLGRVAQQAAAVRRVVQPRLGLLDSGAVIAGFDRADLGADLGLTRRRAVRVGVDDCCHVPHGIAPRMAVEKVRLSLSGRIGRLAGNTSAPGATVTSRLLSVLAAFDERHRSLTLTELAGRAGIPVPTAHRLVG